MPELTTLQTFAVWVLPVLFAITVHEVAHGYVANMFGDKTAMILGRLTLNPLKHIDLIGTILVPAILFFLGGFVFGWAKPVPINARNMRHPARDMAIVAAAGPISNLLMAFIWAAVAKLGLILVGHNLTVFLALIYMGKAGIMINLVLGTLNLIPIPPLDGSHILLLFLPREWGYQLSRLAPYGFFILLILISFGIFRLILTPIISLLFGLIATIFGF